MIWRSERIDKIAPVTCRSCKGSTSYIARSTVQRHCLAAPEKEKLILQWVRPNTKDRWSHTRCVIIEDSTGHESGQEESIEGTWDVALAMECGKEDFEELDAEATGSPSSRAPSAVSESAG
jgi:hypothetical protein